MIELLKRPEGATVEQIAEVTGWQKHTIRGAISGALKKKLGLTVETTRTREVGPNKTGAKGSSTPSTGSPGRARAPSEDSDGSRLMILAPRPGRYRLHGLGSPEADAVLAEQGVTEADLDRALAELERSEGVRVRSIVGINHDAVFGSTRAGWHPDLPDACKEPFIPLLWVKILELLGRVPAGSTARFLQDGTLPD